MRLLDTIRGVMVIYMLYYHTLYDLGFMFGFSWARRQFSDQPFSQMIIGCSFVFIAGLTIRFSRSPALHGARLLLIAGCITLVTAFVFDGSAIYFGVLHLLAICMLVYACAGRVIERIPWWITAAVGFVLYLCTYWVSDGFFGIKGLLELPVPGALTANNMLTPFGFVGSNFASADYYPLLPWLFLFLCGCGVGKLLDRDRLPGWLTRDFCPPLTFLGRRSLTVYVIHQPIIYGAIYLIVLLIGK